jgi:hypothetical protein
MGLMELWLDVYDASNNLIGPGPLAALQQFKLSQPLSAAGRWSALIPALDLRAMELLQPKRKVQAYTWAPDGGRLYLGGGVVEDLRVKITDGVPMLEAGGSDLLCELAQTVVPYAETANGETTIRASMPAGWTIVETDTLPTWATRYAYESTLAAWARAAEQVGFLFRLAPSGATIRRLELFRNVTSSGIRATLHAGAPAIDRNETLCLIRSLSEQRSSWDIANRAYVFGAGDWRAQLTLAYATLWPDGTATTTTYTDGDGNTWTITKAESRIDCTSSQATYGTLPVRVDAKNIGPLTNSTADLQAAANALLAAALQTMRSRVAPQYAYDLEVSALRTPLLPGQSIWVEARQMVDGERPVDINRALNVLSIETTWDRDGVRADKLTVATNTTLPRTDSSVLVNAIQAAQINSTYPQLSASVDTVSYSDPIDDSHGAELPFWLGEETATINQILLRFRVDPLRSTAKAIGGTISGTVALTPHTHDVTIDNHTHNVTVADHTHSVTVAAHTHDVTIAGHTHSIPDHQHKLKIIGNGTGALTNAIGFGAGGRAGGVRHNIDTTDWDWVTNADSGATTSASGGSSTPTSSSGGGATVTSANGGGATVTSANGGAQTKTSATGGGGTFSLSLTSALALVYGIFEESGANTYAYGALEWRVNGTLVTATPTSLGSGWYSLDLTSYVVDSGGLRPAAAANVVAVAIKAASKVGKTCQIKAQLERRTIIQAIAYA